MKTTAEAMVATAEAHEAAADAHEAVAEAVVTANEAVIEAAQERVEEAHEVAEAVVEAAMVTELGRRIAAVEGEILWLGENGGRAGLENQVRQLQEQNAALETRLLKAEDALTMLSQTPQPLPVTMAEPSSTLQTLAETMAETVEPQSLETPPSAAVVVPVPVEPAKRRIKLL